MANAVDRGFICYPFIAEYDPFLETVRREPGFTRLLAAVKPRWEAVVEWEWQRRPVSAV